MKFNIEQRPRRLRSSEAVRRMVRETILSPADFINPLFVTGGHDRREPIESMPGVFRLSVDQAVREAGSIFSHGIPAVLLFGIPAYKDAVGSSAYDPDEAVQRAIRAIKDRYPDRLVMTDICLCEYTDHGHCGLIEGHKILNDQTLELLNQIAISHARAGADMLAPSDMMDGRVRSLRGALDSEGFEDIILMPYAVKYASAHYGPFRDAAGSAPRFGDRKTYQMDPANIREALREAALDQEEGADILIVKPALAYLDVIKAVKAASNLPLATYNVSGEYAMVKAAAENGWIDEERVVLEQLTAMKRAGADLIITYHARNAVRWLEKVNDAVREGCIW